MYAIIFSPTSQSQFDKLEKKIQNRILLSLERIRIRPHNFVKKLSGYPFFRLRTGEYRIILDIKNDCLTIIVIEIGHRKNIYKPFK